MTGQRTWSLVGCCAGLVLLVMAASAQEAPDPAGSDSEKDRNGEQATQVEGRQEDPPADQAGSETAPSQDDTPMPISAEDVLREFQRDRPRARPVLPRPPEDEVLVRQGMEERGTDGPSPRIPEGYPLVDRTGRLTRDGEWWVYTFVADNNPAESPEPPMKLLPNQMLERMVRESQGATRSMEFIVSGEVTYFMGENYLLVRKLMRKREMGNLSS